LDTIKNILGVQSKVEKAKRKGERGEGDSMLSLWGALRAAITEGFKGF
jgi:hypothetical protein